MNADGVQRSTGIQMYNYAVYKDVPAEVSEHKMNWSCQLFAPLIWFLHPGTLALISAFSLSHPAKKPEQMHSLTKYFLMLLVTSENS